LSPTPQALAEYCAGFQLGDSIDSFLPTVTLRLRERDPVAYADSQPNVNKQKLQRRLWAGIKREAGKYSEVRALCVNRQCSCCIYTYANGEMQDSPLRKALVRDKGIKVGVIPWVRQDWEKQTQGC
jgi:hypothetical protein